jgi:NAD+ diphosphatase
MVFIASHIPPEGANKNESLFFLIKGQEILVRRQRDTGLIPSGVDIELSDPALHETHFIGTLNGHLCFAVPFGGELEIPSSLHLLALRDAFRQLADDEIQAISLAKQVLTWSRDFRFCGRCGSPTKELEEQRVKRCPACKATYYPRLSPSIIVSVVKDDQILLARSARFPKGMYSVLAGFVEAGETLEECIRREVREEVGIEIHKIRYFGSQNWPFPHSLMIGFTAEYLSGKLRINNDEIVDARWYKASELPKLPGRYSIARKIIDHFCGCFSSKEGDNH